MASLSIGSVENLENLRKSHGISRDNRIIIGIKEKLGSIEYSDVEKEQYIAHIAGNSSDDDVRKYIENRSYHVFEQISKSWNGIIDLCSKKS